MRLDELDYYYRKFKQDDDVFHNLMQHRIQDVLLVSCLFDAYVLEKDGFLSEQIYGEYRMLDLTTAPRITTINFSDDVPRIIEEQHFDLVIVMMRMGTTSPFEMSRRIRQMHPDLPLLLLLNKQSYVEMFHTGKCDADCFDDVFLWNGDTKLFVAMIKLMEDRLNAEQDILQQQIRSVLLIESSISYYSQFLPLFYAEAMRLTQELADSEESEVQKRLRMRARPKILLAHDYDGALELFRKYRESIICVITNSNLKVDGMFNIRGGIKLIRRIRDEHADLPILLQSAEQENRIDARKLEAVFLDKNDPNLLHDIRQFIVDNLGFGDFVFRDAAGNELRRARGMYAFTRALQEVPDESILYHADHNHFSAWLMAHGQVEVARQIRYIMAADFLSVEDVRRFVLETIYKVYKEKNRGKVIRFSPDIFLDTGESKILQLADGSLGGKGRGLAFLNALLVTMDLDTEFESVSIKLPNTAIIGTNEFDLFVQNNQIEYRQLINRSDAEIDQVFVQGSLSGELQSRLRTLISHVQTPLAVRSSGLLEDSQSQPFAGIYRTFMVPNCHPDVEVRLRQLCDAVKLVLASPFMESARRYIESINYKLEEEKMAVVIQEVIGGEHDGLFYPHFSGAAQSYNFYPTKRMVHEDGIAALALGMGKSVVDGERAHRYSPDHPKVDMLAPEDIVENNQREFYAVDLQPDHQIELTSETSFMKKVRISQKLKQGIFKELTSVWDYENFQFVDGLFAQGPRVITYRNILHFNRFPLSGLLTRILDIGKAAFGVPVEIEFAVNLHPAMNDTQPAFYLLQIRPLSVNFTTVEIDLDAVDEEKLLLYTRHSMGNGEIASIQDVVYIDPADFDNTQTLEMEMELEEINRVLKQEGREYVLIGPGRWGSSDRFLGVPVKWPQIDAARIIVEVGLEHFSVEASQGSHFFHNLVAMNVGYFTVPYNNGVDRVSWDKLRAQPKMRKTKFFNWVKLSTPLIVRIDGRSGIAIVECDVSG
jgi:CheY-like chemotaxis protein